MSAMRRMAPFSPASLARWPSSAAMAARQVSMLVSWSFV
jgi:hypothetical protein